MLHFCTELVVITFFLSERGDLPPEDGAVVIGMTQEILELERSLPLQERREAVDSALPETPP